jgi:ParB family chromosome partitioning protein
MSAKTFAGKGLGEIAGAEDVLSGSKGRPAASTTGATMGELAVRGASGPTSERITILQVEPKRCRAWKHHDRSSVWYTRERCADLIESLPREGQQEPAVARRLEGGGEYDFELISGMRRRFACEFVGVPLKIRVVSVDDRRAAVLMHLENADRQDISPMERAISCFKQLQEKVFRTQEEMAEAKRLSTGMITQMIKAAEIMSLETIGKLFPDVTLVPITGAYKLAVMMGDSATREVILSAAKYLAKKPDTLERGPAQILKLLLESPSRSRQGEAPVKKTLNLGRVGKIDVTRNARGKITLAFPKGFQSATEDEVLAAVRSVYQDLKPGDDLGTKPQ